MHLAHSKQNGILISIIINDNFFKRIVISKSQSFFIMSHTWKNMGWEYTNMPKHFIDWWARCYLHFSWLRFSMDILRYELSSLQRTFQKQSGAWLYVTNVQQVAGQHREKNTKQHKWSGKGCCGTMHLNTQKNVVTIILLQRTPWVIFLPFHKWKITGR